jgi:hypothetical protein
VVPARLRIQTALPLLSVSTSSTCTSKSITPRLAQALQVGPLGVRLPLDRPREPTLPIINIWSHRCIADGQTEVPLSSALSRSPRRHDRFVILVEGRIWGAEGRDAMADDTSH